MVSCFMFKTGNFPKRKNDEKTCLQGKAEAHHTHAHIP